MQFLLLLDQHLLKNVKKQRFLHLQYGYKNITGKFEPNLFVNIEDTWIDKLNALKFYKEEIKEYPHSRSYKGIENLAKVRGNQVGLDRAEAFEVIRKIDL